MRIEVLGPIRVTDGDLEVPLGGPQQRLILALLVAAAGEVLATEQLIESVWNGEVPRSARKTIQVHVSALRRSLPNTAAITTIAGGYALGPDAETDVAEFEELISRGRRELDRRLTTASETLRQALELWRGAPYAELRYEEALSAEIRRLDEAHLRTVEDKFEADLLVGRTAIDKLEALITDHPLRERLRGLQMRSLYARGRQADALQSYRDFSTSLAEDLGLDPSPELQALELRILQQDPALDTFPATDGVGTTTPISLPSRYSTYVGRSKEISDVLSSIREHRLVTLVGPGGIGKSSLAVECLQSDALGGSAPPPVWIDVEGTDEQSLALASAMALGLRPGPSIDPQELIVSYIGNSPHTILFDGCEPLISEAAELIHHLLQSCPGLKVVATSREPLQLIGENLIRVAPLESDDARELLSDRAALGSTAATGPTADQIDAICAALDGIPLAIELSAARLYGMSASELVEHLDDQVSLLRLGRGSDSRHGSLTSALDWSYRLLEPPDQRAFRHLAIFRHFQPSSAPPGTVERLLEASLVQPANEHNEHRMLEPIRQYAVSLLHDDDLGAARSEHAEWVADYCGGVAASMQTLREVDFGGWVARNRTELVSALEWSVLGDIPDVGASIVAAVGREIGNQGFGSLILDIAMEIIHHPEVRHTPELAIAMAHIAHIQHLSLDNESPVELSERAVDVATRLGDPVALGTALARHADLAFRINGSTEASLQEMANALEILEPTGRTDTLDFFNAADMAVAVGDSEMVESLMTRCFDWESQHVGRSGGEVEHIASVTAMLRGDLDDAIRLRREAASLRLEEEAFLYGRADMEAVASLLTYANRMQEAAEAIATARALGKVIGADDHDLTPSLLRVLVDSKAFGSAIATARQWLLRLAASERPLTFRLSSTTAHLEGSRGVVPPFIDLLLPLTGALMHNGTPRACRFAHAAPSLMRQSGFEAWDQIGDVARWQQLEQQCGDPGHSQIELTLQRALAEVVAIVTPLGEVRSDQADGH